MAIRRERGHSLHIVDFLVENASNLDATTVDGHTAVHYCALYNQPECLKLLLRSGANVAAETKDKKTAIDLAKEYGSTACEDLVALILLDVKESQLILWVVLLFKSDSPVNAKPQISAGKCQH